MNQSGFPTSVLFPGDLQHPLNERDERYNVPSEPLPTAPSTAPATETGVPEGSPQTPPTINMRQFNFGLDNEE